MIKKLISMPLDYMYKKKILIVCRSFYPEISPRSFRATELAKEFARQGHEVIIYTQTKNLIHKDFETLYHVKIKDLGKSIFKKIPTKSNSFISTVVKLINKSLEIIFLYPEIELIFIIPKTLKNEKGFDLLISLAYPYPVHWGCLLAIKKNKKLTNQWIADCGDPFRSYGAGPKKPFYFRFVDNWFMKRVNKISIPYEELKVYYNIKYHDKILIIPQGFDFSEIKLANYKQNTIPTFAYAGLFIPGFRDPRLFLKYLSSLNFNFKFVIYTRNFEILKPYKELLKERLEIKDYIPREKLLFELSKMDFLVNIQNGNKVDYPSKLIDYALVKRPVININSYTLDISTINEFLNGNYRNRIEMHDVEKFNIKRIVAEYLKYCI